MAEIPYTQIPYNGRSGKHFQWLLGDDDIGQVATLVSDQVELTMAWTGTFDTATLTGEGEIGNSGFIVADDSYGVALSILAGNGIKPIGPGLDKFRPQTATGGGSTALVVTLRVFEKVRP